MALIIRFWAKYPVDGMGGVIHSFKIIDDPTHLRTVIKTTHSGVLVILFSQLKELQTRQAALLTLQRDAEIRLAEAEEEVCLTKFFFT